MKSRGFRIYDTIERFYSESSCDLAVISSPIQFHTPMMLCALSHASHVLCEKPLTGDAGDIDTLIDARERSGRFVMIGYQWSHSEAILNMKRDIAAGYTARPSFSRLSSSGRATAPTSSAAAAGRGKFATPRDA